MERYKTPSAVMLMLTRERDGRVETLLQRRANTGYMDGRWDVSASGHVEEGETMRRAMVREAREELGVYLLEDDLRFATLQHSLDGATYTNVFFFADKWEGEPCVREADKCSEICWFDIDRLPGEAIPSRLDAIARAMRGASYCEWPPEISEAKYPVRLALKEDFDDWVSVAGSVKATFRSPFMDTDPEFLSYARRKIAQEDAVCAFEAATGRCVGFVGFSQHFNRVTWVGVRDGFQGHGIGGRLLREALSRLDISKPITVDTYRLDYPPGAPARRLYAKAGFVETNPSLFDDLGNEIAELTLHPTGERANF